MNKVHIFVREYKNIGKCLKSIQFRYKSRFVLKYNITQCVLK